MPIKKKMMTRSENMSRIKSKNSQMEILLCNALWKRGLRYRKNDKNVYGKPDIVFKSKKIAIFCDSEFWHGKKLKEGEIPKTNTQFWINKISKNINRDTEVNVILKQTNWTVLRYWEKDIKNNPTQIACEIEKIYYSKENKL
jgi:DNA mismatch endonuclease, patch repair protein